MKNIQGTTENLKLFNQDGNKIYEFYVHIDGSSHEYIFDNNGNTLNFKDSAGYSYEYTFDLHDEILTSEDSNGEKRGFDTRKEIDDITECPRFPLFSYFHNEHNLILLDSEIDEIVYHVRTICSMDAELLKKDA